jgi:hypothetical protein
MWTNQFANIVQLINLIVLRARTDSLLNKVFVRRQFLLLKITVSDVVTDSKIARNNQQR